MESQSNKSFRIKANINNDKVLNVHLAQDMDFLEILSLKLKQTDLYKIHTSNYGLLIGRVLANDSFGIPNAKISIFAPILDEDKENSEIFSQYPYTSINDRDNENRRYNLLPDNSNNECYMVVGTFPHKRLVLDDNTILEIFDKYYKYTTVTNESGDYCIPSLLVGNNELHVDIDLSDIGPNLSQKPYDFFYKGFNETLFSNSRQFKSSTELDNLVHIFSQNQGCYVYPFWGDKEQGEVAITRCDIKIQYKFEPTCIFMGSVVSDAFSGNNLISHDCKPLRNTGMNKKLIAGEGTIETIRKTLDGVIEEVQIQGNRLIDGDGIFCYQIPMNLDLVATDEYGNIVPSDDPTKGIPTRTSCRFRFSLYEDSEGSGRHRAKYLVPNNPSLEDDENNTLPRYDDVNGTRTLDSYYEFGSSTNEDCFRDLYWNKVYSVKNYIPRLQKSKRVRTNNYSGLRSTNFSDHNNAVPFNKIKFNLTFTYRLSCILAVIVLNLMCAINATIIYIIDMFFGWLCGVKIPVIHVRPFGFACKLIIDCLEFSFLTDADEGSCAIRCFYPCCKGQAKKYTLKHNRDKCDAIETSTSLMKNKLEQLLAEENEAVQLDFYNDWLNGALYMPVWYWKKRKKKTFFFNLITLKGAKNEYCDCDKKKKVKMFWPCSFTYDKKYNIMDKLDIYNIDNKWHEKYDRIDTYYGIVKEKETLSGLKAYYYAPGVLYHQDYTNDKNQARDFARYFATDIILLGSLNDCDLNGIPQLFKNLPPTTANIMPINRDAEQNCDTDTDSEPVKEVTGQDFWTDLNANESVFTGNGYFMNIGCSTIQTLPKTCVNAERLSELGVDLDMTFSKIKPQGENFNKFDLLADGMVTKIELTNHMPRSMFATLNHNGLQNLEYNPKTGYYFYKLRYIYPVNFDGRMNKYSSAYTSKLDKKTTDNTNESYTMFRLGGTYNKSKEFINAKFYKKDKNYSFPLYNNSYYFYFGLTEGKTAIDKFNRKYFASCFQNKKEPFTMLITEFPAIFTPTDEGNGEFGAIRIELGNIRKPYKYRILDEYKESLLGDYIECDKDILIFDQYFDINGKNCYDEDKDKQFKITNGVYYIEIVDANGNFIVKKVNLYQNKVTMDSEATPLNKKYYCGGISEKKDFKPCEDELYGGITINEIVFDGCTYTLDNGIQYMGGNKFSINGVLSGAQVHNNDGKDEIIKPRDIRNYDENHTFIIEITNIQEDDCGKLHDFSEMYMDECDDPSDNFIPIWIPSRFKYKIYDSEAPNNYTEGEFEVLNGKPFDLVLSGLELKYIIGKKRDYINSNFYSATSPADSWFMLKNEETYKFDEFTNIYDNRQYWEELFNNLYFNEQQGVSLNLFNDMMKFKLQAILRIENSAYVNNDSINGWDISHVGGRAPILYRTMYPDYNAFTGEELEGEFNKYLYNSSNYIECDGIHPNITSYNYQYYRKDLGIQLYYLLGGFTPNKLHNDKDHIGNYIALFSNNGGWDGTAFTKSTESVPPKAKQNEGIKPGVEGKYTEYLPYMYQPMGDNLPYFNAQFLDRRLDYAFMIVTPFSGESLLKLSPKEGKVNWTMGRIVALTYNGIEMAYDEETKNIIGDNFEYKKGSYKEENTDLTPWEYVKDGEKKLLYEALIKSNGVELDFRRSLLAKGNKKEEPEDPIPNKEVPDKPFLKTKFKGLSNNYFDKNNYPTRRYMDIVNIPHGSDIEVTMSPCSYNLNVDYDEQKEIQCIAKRDGEVSFRVDCKNCINPFENDIETCMQNDTYNIRYVFSGHSLAKWFKLIFSIGKDNLNESHEISNALPLIASFYEDENYIKKLKTEGDGDVNAFDIIDNFLYGKFKKIRDLHDAPSGCAIKTWSKDNNGNNKEYVFNNNENDKVPMFESSSDFDKVYYNVKKFDISTKDFVSIVADKLYTSSEGDFLTKRVRVINTSALYDTRPIDIQIIETRIEDIKDDSTEVEGDVTIPNPPTPPEGGGDNPNPDEGGGENPNPEEPNKNQEKAEPNQGENTPENGEGETAPDGGGQKVPIDAEANVKTQIVVYELSGNNTILQDYENCEIGIKYFISYDTAVNVEKEAILKNIKCEPIMATDVDGNEVFSSLKVTATWNGTMKNVFIENGGKYTITSDFFIKPSNKLVYSIPFDDYN